ncbi:MAG: ribonuclease E/G, partial [Planctomycetota bacterium]
MGRSLLFNLRDPEEPRVAVLEGRRLAEVGVETEDRGRLQGDVFLGRVIRVEPAVQAAFVDIGFEKPGFLHVADVMKTCGSHPDEPGRWAERQRGHYGKIQDLLVKGQTVLVQVTRDPLATKGPTLTTFLSLPGQWLVLMPSLGRAGVSRRIADAEERALAQERMAALDLPEGLGVILRTAGAGRSTEELARDLEVLKGRFDAWLERARRDKPPVRLHRESGLLERTLRDWLAEPVEEVIVDTEEGLEAARQFLEQSAPPWKNRLSLHDGAMPLFHDRGVEDSVDKLFRRRVALP